MTYSITPNVLSVGNHLKFNNHIIKITEIQKENLIIEFQDGTRLYSPYSDVKGINTESSVLSSLGLTKISSKKILLHTQDIFEIDIKGKKYFLKGLIFDDSIIWRFDNFLSFHYIHQLQNICSLVNPEYELKFF